ncbi:hypothetical protein [Reichenbachiella ulvae]|uniref:Uncharacterized protein n=1 Tax=Reichenbachiella ulvae TaxID=2980104 RepID=A0ABT3CUU5_9BACT|nr:hypothetical protein [Reichenbachiella ulvae]MCV9387471.1 hypothetical protein [Reichenbachiella ulvae]
MKQIIMFLGLVLLGLQLIAQPADSEWGYFGGNASASGFENTGNTANKWIRIAELTLNGNYNAASVEITFHPKNSNHGDSKHELFVGFRNNKVGLEPTYDIRLNHVYGYNKSIKDVKAVHYAGTGTSGNKIAVWVQMSVSWLSNVPIEVRTIGSVDCKMTNYIYHATIQDTGTVYELNSYYGMINSVFYVTGTVKTNEVKVEATQWPDYVFEEGYELPSLENTANYIQEYGHLPGVPSASEVNENGVSLGEMNEVLLKKIEELTLHLIEKDQEILEIKREIEALKKNQ